MNITSRMLALGAIAISTLSLIPGESKATPSYPLIQDMIFIGCSVPSQGTNGMSVYSIEAVAGNGKWIATELGDTKKEVDDLFDKKCSQVLNKIIGTGKGCPEYNVWQPVIEPSFNALHNTGYGLNLFMLMCAPQYSG